MLAASSINKVLDSSNLFHAHNAILYLERLLKRCYGDKCILLLHPLTMGIIGVHHLWLLLQKCQNNAFNVFVVKNVWCSETKNSKQYTWLYFNWCLFLCVHILVSKLEKIHINIILYTRRRLLTLVFIEGCTYEGKVVFHFIPWGEAFACSSTDLHGFLYSKEYILWTKNDEKTSVEVCLK